MSRRRLPQAGDLVERIDSPWLDHRVVDAAVGTVLTLRIGNSVTPPLRRYDYRVIKTAEELRALRGEAS